MMEYTCVREGLVCPVCGAEDMALYTFISSIGHLGLWRSDWFVCDCGHTSLAYVNANGYDEMTDPVAFVPQSHLMAVEDIAAGHKPPKDWTYVLSYIL